MGRLAEMQRKLLEVSTDSSRRKIELIAARCSK